MRRRQDLESELKALNDVLSSHNVSRTEELIDEDGFPRNDIDIVTVRKTRAHIVYIQNDLRDIMDKIEEGLHKVHANAREEKVHLGTTNYENESKPILSPFLKVDTVTDGSPAKLAGLQVDDLVLAFGSVTLQNFSSLQVIGSIVQYSKGKEIIVTVKRGENVNDLKLTPKDWSGKGLLGCNIVPY